MERALVVVDDTDTHRDLLAEAGSLAEGVDADLVLFSWVTPEDLHSNAEALEAAGRIEGTNYGEVSGEEVVRGIVDGVAADAFEDTPTSYDVAAAVTDTDDLPEAIIDAATSHDCEHIFLVGKRRSPTGKVIFGDIAQQVILNFDGYVTVTMT
jgi:nucleotide-binding universal stress UspA family protein